MIINVCVLTLSLALFADIAVAQTPSWPITNGRQRQPAQQQLDRSQDDRAREWNRRVQPELDRIYEELTRDSPARRR
jgi:hypothetical protein